MKWQRNYTSLSPFKCSIKIKLSPVKQQELVRWLVLFTRGRWLIWSIIIKVVIKASHLHSHCRAHTTPFCHLCPDVAGRVWRGILELHWQREVFSLSSTPLLSFISVLQKTDNMRFLSGVLWHTVQQIRLWTTRKTESGEALRLLCAMM